MHSTASGSAETGGARTDAPVVAVLRVGSVADEASPAPMHHDKADASPKKEKVRVVGGGNGVLQSSPFASLADLGFFLIELPREDPIADSLFGLSSAAASFFSSGSAIKGMVAKGLATDADVGYHCDPGGEGKRALESFVVHAPARAGVPFPWPLVPANFRPTVEEAFHSMQLIALAALCEMLELSDDRRLGLMEACENASSLSDYSESVLFLRRLCPAAATPTQVDGAVGAHTDSGTLTLIPIFGDTIKGLRTWSQRHKQWNDVWECISSHQLHLKEQGEECDQSTEDKEPFRFAVMGGEALAPLASAAASSSSKVCTALSSEKNTADDASSLSSRPSPNPLFAASVHCVVLPQIDDDAAAAAATTSCSTGTTTFEGERGSLKARDTFPFQLRLPVEAHRQLTVRMKEAEGEMMDGGGGGGEDLPRLSKLGARMIAF